MSHLICKIISFALCICLLLPQNIIAVSAEEAEDSIASPILSVENITITEGSPYDLTTDASANSVMTLTEGTIIIHYLSTSSKAFQSLFSVSNSTDDNPDRHFHVYITPSGTLGMELRNTDSEFKYTMSAENAVTAGEENIVAFSADSESGVYKLFANGELVSTLTEDEYVFINDITGLDTVSLGSTVRSGNNYPFGGTIFSAEVYDTVLSDPVLAAATSVSGEVPEETEPEETQPEETESEVDSGPVLLIHEQNVDITEGTAYDLTSHVAASAVMALTEGTVVVHYESTGTGTYQSLFSVSNSTTDNPDRHFQVYITPSGTLGMELRNTDSVFKYTMSAASAVTSGEENIIAFSADSETSTYKLFANGQLVASLTKDEYVFIDDITGVDTISLGKTVRNGNTYPFAGTIYDAKVYDAPLTDAELITATTLSGSDSGSTEPVTVSLTRENVAVTSGTVADLTEATDAAGIFEMQEGTILIKYTSTATNSIQSLFSVANSTSGNQNRHFHVYITPGGLLGFELRNTDDVFKYTGNRASSVRNSYSGEAAPNTIAFRADAESKTYTLFANGQKLTTVSVDDYKFISDITGIDTISIGGTVRSGAVSYPFGGTIHSLLVSSEVYSDEYLIHATNDTTYGTFIFSSEDGLNCNYYRIPSLLTLKSGKVVAAADARFGGTHDSKSNIDTAFAYSTDNGQTWSNPIMPFHFDDYADQKVEWPTQTGLRDLRIQGSASFIDPVMIQDSESGRLFIFVDVMPAGIGSSNASVGNGYKTIDGNQYLKLRWHEDSSGTYNYSLRDGVIYDDTTNTATEYTVNSDFEVLKNGTPLTVKQYSVNISGSTLNEVQTDVDVAMNVFYKDSVFKVYPTSYLGMVYSDDEGLSWSSMQLLNTLKSDSEKLLITGPGVGIQIKNGTYSGRLVVPVYSVTLAGFGVIYSDDGGTNWTYAPADTSSNGSTAEAQIVEMPDGSLKVFLRTSSSYVAERTSIDGGVTWSEGVAVDEIATTSYGTQLSVINYSGTIDGKPAIILSSPNATGGRNTGKIRIGLINDTGATGVDKYEIDWAYEYTVDGTVGYSYSCLSELANGNIGVLYEKYDSWSREQLHLINVLPFETYSISQLTSE